MMYKVRIKKQGGDWVESEPFEDFRAADFYAWAAKSAAAIAMRQLEVEVVRVGARVVEGVSNESK